MRARSQSVLNHRRRGAVIVEVALLTSTLMLLLIGFCVLTLGVYRYQHVAHLAREGARYATTHGAQYRADKRLPVGTLAEWKSEIREKGIHPQAVGLIKDKLTVNVSWLTGNNRANAGDSATGYETSLRNTVTVTVTYKWYPEAFIRAPITMTSSSTMPMSY